MSTIVTRSGKGSSLSWTEMDANITNLNTDKIEDDSTDTLTNKTINLSSNTITGTKAQFDTACSDGNFVFQSDIGSSVQAYDADLTTWAGITPGTGVGTALAVNVGTAGSFVTNGGALGTPSGGNLSNCTGYPSVLSASYDSGDLTIALAGAHTLTHSLGGVPKIFNLLAKCTAVGGDAGYAQNEVIVLATNGADAAGSNYGISMKINSTQIILRVGGGAGNNFTNYPHATTGVINGLDYTKWVLIVRAYA